MSYVDPWASYNAGMQNLGSTFEDMAREKKEAPLKALQLRMLQQKADEGELALQQSRQSAADRLALRQKLSEAQPQTKLEMMPEQQKSSAAESLMAPPSYMRQQPETNYIPDNTSPEVKAYQEGRMKPVTTTPDLAEVARQELLSQGNIQEATKAGALAAQNISIDDLMAKRKAEVQMYGSAEQKAKLDVEEARLKTAENLILTSRKADPTGNMTRQMVKAHPELFPGVDPELVTNTGQGLTELPFKGGKIVIGPDGKSHIVKDEEQWSEPFEAQVGGKRVLLQRSASGQIKPVVQDTSTTVRINTGQQGLGKMDAESIKGLLRTMPKLKDEAIQAGSGVERIDTMLDLINRGAGGRTGQLKAAIGPYAEMIGIKSKGMSDAQLYETMAKTIGGSMRLQIVGPGQVSNYENQLLQKISGGGSTGTDAAKELLQYYKSQAENKINDYNASVDSVSEYAPAAGKIYKRVSPKSITRSAQEPQQQKRSGSSTVNRPSLDAIFK